MPVRERENRKNRKNNEESREGRREVTNDSVRQRGCRSGPRNGAPMINLRDPSQRAAASIFGASSHALSQCERGKNYKVEIKKQTKKCKHSVFGIVDDRKRHKHIPACSASRVLSFLSSFFPRRDGTRF